MLRKFKNSFISVIHVDKFNMDEYQYVIQTEKITDSLILVEYYKSYDVDELDFEPLNAPATYQDSEKAAKIAEYKAVTLNNNNFNDKWSNKTLGELFEANDREFIEKAKKEMKNEYIKERIMFLDKELNGK